QGYISKIITVYFYSSFGRIVKTTNQIGNGRFSASGMSDKRHRFSRLDLKADIIERYTLAIVRKLYPIKFDFTGYICQCISIFFVFNVWPFIEKFKYPLRRRHRHEQLIIHLAES